MDENTDLKTFIVCGAGRHTIRAEKMIVSKGELHFNNGRLNYPVAVFAAGQWERAYEDKFADSTDKNK